MNYRFLRYRKKEKNQHQLLTKVLNKQEEIELYNHLENARRVSWIINNEDGDIRTRIFQQKFTFKEKFKISYRSQSHGS